MLYWIISYIPLPITSRIVLYAITSSISLVNEEQLEKANQAKIDQMFRVPCPYIIAVL
jgi:hypothetical protein